MRFKIIDTPSRIWLQEKTNNYLRKRVHRLDAPAPARVLRIEALATHGLPAARLFEVRAY